MLDIIYYILLRTILDKIIYIYIYILGIYIYDTISVFIN